MKSPASLLERLRAYNRTAVAFPRESTVHAELCRRAGRRPDAIAAVAGDRYLSYRELDRRSNRLARCLLAQELGPEPVVGLLLDRSPAAIVAMLAALKAGAAYLALSGDQPLRRLVRQLRTASVRVLVSEKRHLRLLNKLQWSCPELAAFLCLDSRDVHSEREDVGELMRQDTWDYIRREVFDDISGGGFRSSYTGEWLSREVIDDFAANVLAKLEPHLHRQSRILEIGCASGVTMFQLAPIVGLYHGTDMSQAILDWTGQRARELGLSNVRLDRLAADEIDGLDGGYDVVILNSVIHCFSGHNYLREVLRKSIDLLGDRGLIFLGNVWDQELLEDFVRSLESFAAENRGKGYRTKVDRSEELFLARGFFEDLCWDLPQIEGVEWSRLGKVRSELSEYSYDVVIRIDKSGTRRRPPAIRHKRQLDRRALEPLSSAALSRRRGSPASLAYVLYTSGTSGRPKGVMIGHRALLRLVIDNGYCDFRSSDRVLQPGPLTFDASAFEIWGALLNGGTVCFLPKTVVMSPIELRSSVRRQRITIALLITSLFNTVVDDDPEVVRGLRILLVGGERASPRHINTVRRACPSLALVNAYGPTESACIATAFEIEEPLTGDVPIGSPAANTTCYVLDPDLEPVAEGVAGELCIGGDGLARGYLGDPALTAERFVPHPLAGGERLYRTGDRVQWRAGGCLEFLGRIDQQVKIRGYRIEPTEVETVLAEHEAVHQAVVLARTVAEERTHLVAYVTGSEDLEASALRDDLRRSLPEYMIPAFFVTLAKLPLNPNGKVDRDALPPPQERHRPVHAAFEPPRSDVERQLTSIWRKVLKRQEIGATDNFFDIGGDSLKVTEVAMLVRQQMGEEISIATVMRNSTVRGLAAQISKGRSDESPRFSSRRDGSG